MTSFLAADRMLVLSAVVFPLSYQKTMQDGAPDDATGSVSVRPFQEPQLESVSYFHSIDPLSKQTTSLTYEEWQALSPSAQAALVQEAVARHSMEISCSLFRLELRQLTSANLFSAALTKMAELVDTLTEDL